MKMPYFNLKDAFESVRDDFSYGDSVDKLKSASALVGKSAANMGMLAVEAGVIVAKNLPEISAKIIQSNLDKNGHLMSDEQRSKYEDVLDRHKNGK